MMGYLNRSTLFGNRKHRSPPLRRHKFASVRIGLAVRAGLEAREYALTSTIVTSPTQCALQPSRQILTSTAIVLGPASSDVTVGDPTGPRTYLLLVLPAATTGDPGTEHAHAQHGDGSGLRGRGWGRLDVGS